MEQPGACEADAADREQDRHQSRRTHEHRAVAEHDEQRRAQEPPRQARDPSAEEVRAAQLQQVLLDRDHRRRVVDARNMPLHDAAGDDQADAVGMQHQRRQQHRQVRRVVGPVRAQCECAGAADEHLRGLSPYERAQPASRTVHARVAQQLQVQCVLLLEAAVEGLPRELEIVEFHAGIHLSVRTGRGCVA